ncbi:MAG: protease inhibitor I42 family protein [candidate division WOR-3 bacterium]|nr:protease inhibitor I42 family protein [candidate division WOR-3 bacterium]
MSDSGSQSQLLRITLLIGLAAFVASCTKSVYLTATDNSRTVALVKGQRVAISLEANSTTGYHWELAECDSAILAPQGEPTYAASRTSPIGSGGQASWRFRAMARGKTELRLVCRRSWENESEPGRTFAVTVVVR